MENLYDIEAVADWTRRSKQALYNERHRGEGIGALGFKVGKKLLWRESDLVAYIEAQQAAQVAG